MVKRIDLHMHTKFSDGELSPKEIIDEAVKNKVNIISITDHDTTDAYCCELYEYAKSKNIDLINGVEISTKIKKCGIHVLGYNFDVNDINLKNNLSKLRNARHDYLFEVADKLKDLGYYINIKELNKIDSVTKAHIALDVIENEINFDLLMKNFGYIPNKGNFIETIMNESCPAFVEKKTCSPKEASEFIRKAGGKVILAHPVAYYYEDGLSDDNIQEIINEMKPDGIEAYYIYYNRNDIKINDIDKWVNFTKKQNLFYTIGSDFHKISNTSIQVGLDPLEYKLTEEEVDLIIKNIKE